MNKLLIVTPNEQIYQHAMVIVTEAFINAKVVKAKSDDVVEMVKAEFAADTGVVVARGNHAHLLKTYTNIPVVDIELTGQDMAVLLDQACKTVAHPNPRIAFVGFRYMFSNCTPIANILGADVRIYYASSGRDIPNVVERAVGEGAELIIGGEIACSHATHMGVLSLFMDSMKESLRYAIRSALHMMDALKEEQRKTAEFMSLLNYSFDAILRLDEKGDIQVVNYMAERVLHHTSAELIGMNFFDIPRMQSSSVLKEAIEQQRSLYSTVLRIDADSFVVNIATINVEDRKDGFIVSMQAFSKIDDLEKTIRLERRRLGYVAKAKFTDIVTRSPRMLWFLEDAQQYALYDVPVLIVGPVGTQKRILAECIHNASPRQPNPFVLIDLSVIPANIQTEQIFGVENNDRKRGLFAMGQKGTVFFDHVHLLSDENQNHLLNILRHGHYTRGNSQLPVSALTRIICSTSFDLDKLVEKGTFLGPLVRQLSRMTLAYPPLSETREDIPYLLDKALNRAAVKYKKRITLTDDAVSLLIRYDWPGNILDLDTLCERATILARSTRLDAEFIRKRLLPKGYEQQEEQTVMVISSAEENELRSALREHAGDRQAVADGLGISRSTLWRRMKKYGLLDSDGKQ